MSTDATEAKLVALVPGLERDHLTDKSSTISSSISHSLRQTLNAAVMRFDTNLSREALSSPDTTWNDLLAWMDRADNRPAARPPRGSYRTPSATLRPIVPADIEALYLASLDPITTHRWRFRGTTPSFSDFTAAMYASDVLSQYMVINAEDGAPVGLAVAYAPSHIARHAKVALQRVNVAQEHQGSTQGLMIEGFMAFVQFLFDHFDLRRVYLEVPEYNMSLFDIGAGSIFDVEGRLRDHLYWGDRLWDMYILTLDRERWDEAAMHIRGEWPEDHFEKASFPSRASDLQ